MANPIRVLHVDDDPEFATETAEFLGRMDGRFDVEHVDGADAALAALEDGTFDCVVSDYEMPDGNGLELLEEVRTSYRYLPFVLFTGEGSEAVASDAISAGATDYLQKRPGTDQYDILANRIRNAVRRVEHRERLDELHEVAIDLESTTTVEAACERTVDAARNLLAFVSASVSLYRPETDEFETVAAENTVFDMPHRIPAEGSLAERTRREGETVVVGDVSTTDEVREDDARTAALSVPIGDHGVIQVGSDSAGAFDASDVELLELLASHTAGVLDRIDRRRALERERDRSETLFRALPEPTVSFPETENGVVGDVNPAFEEVFGYDAEEARGEDINELIVPSDRQAAAARIDDRAEEVSMLRREVQRETADGELRDFLLLATGVGGIEGTQETFAIYTDITDRVEAERELRRQNERLEEFASVVTHDLRNPLNVAEGRVELAREEPDGDHLDAAADALARMRTLIDDLLTLARSGERVGDPEPVALGALVDDCWRGVDTADAALVTDVDHTVNCDPRRVRQLLENLVRNAVEHGGEDVTVTVGDLDDGFYVADDGPGIPADERDRVFESGYSTADEGTGFGLSIVGEIVDAHGWDVRVTESDAGGARFEVTGVDVVD